MRTIGTGMTRQRIGVEWPSPVEVVPVGEPEPVIIHAEPLPPLHLCEVPDSMLRSREQLASAWAKRAPAKPATKSTSTTKKARSRKNTKSKG